MKIGFYGNANNYPFMLARAVQRLGHEVVFLIASRERLNRPENLYGEITLPYPPWIIDVSHRFRWHCLVPGLGRHKVLEQLNACDAVILNEEGPALAPQLRVPYAVLLTGSDVEVFANPALAASLRPQAFKRPVWARDLSRRILPVSLILRQLIRPQRAGIKGASTVAFLPEGLVPNADRLLKEIGVTPEQRIGVQFTDCGLAPYTPPALNATVRIFSATRLTWLAEPGTGLTPLDLKGSDIMLRGLGEFWRKTRQPLDIHLVKKGRHVAQTMELAAQLELTDQITWHEEMNQREVLVQFRAADIVFEQLGQSAVGMAGLDAMSTGRPLIANGRPEIFEPLTGQSSPIRQARTAEAVCAQLTELVFSSPKRLKVGLASRGYVEAHFSAESAARRLVTALAGSANSMPGHS